MLMLDNRTNSYLQKYRYILENEIILQQNGSNLRERGAKKKYEGNKIISFTYRDTCKVGREKKILRQ